MTFKAVMGVVNNTTSTGFIAYREASIIGLTALVLDVTLLVFNSKKWETSISW